MSLLPPRFPEGFAAVPSPPAAAASVAPVSLSSNVIVHPGKLRSSHNRNSPCQQQTALRACRNGLLRIWWNLINMVNCPVTVRDTNSRKRLRKGLWQGEKKKLCQQKFAATSLMPTRVPNQGDGQGETLFK